jgi:hypothetical protein
MGAAATVKDSATPGVAANATDGYFGMPIRPRRNTALRPTPLAE